MVTEKDWLKAVKKISKRFEFVKSINLKELNKYVDEIYYKNTQKSNFLMETSIKYLFQKNNKLTSRIIIYPFAFLKENYSFLEDFLGELFYHEGFHAKEIYEKNPLMIYPPSENFPKQREIYFINRELRACRNQIKYFNKKNSAFYKKMVFNRIKDYKKFLENLQ